MSTLEIKKVGPINQVQFDLNRINCFIGPQCSGKSTIAKIISFCMWLEKDVLIHRNKNYIDQEFFHKNLLVFHQLEHSFTEESFIKYKSTILSFCYSKHDCLIELEEGFSQGKVGKNAYIPAERNVLTLPGILTLPLGDTNLKSFISDWTMIHNKYTLENTIELLNLKVKYYYDEKKQQDMLMLENGKNISLHEASSGLQSAVPLALYVDYLTNWIYKHVNDTSVKMRKKLELAVLKEFLKAIPTSSLSEDKIQEIYENENYRNLFKADIEIFRTLIRDIKSDDKAVTTPLDSFFLLEENITKPHFSNIIIEEPEQNLFPETQVTLVNYILKKINKDRDNLVITTHSPYILYALNNCMLGGLVKDNIEDDASWQNIQSAWIHPSQVSVWALTAEGKFLEVEGAVRATIQDEEGLIRKNYLDDSMRHIMSEFTNLLNYYE